VRQSKLENYVAEIDVIPNAGENIPVFTAALQQRLKQISGVFPNLTLQNNGKAIRVSIPAEDRARGGSMSAQLVEQFLRYVNNPASIPNWEKPSMLAKYYITTTAVALAGKSQ
jgi:hypothetical protein